MKDLDIELGGVTLRLCPERAAFRPAEGELLVADVHIGKAAAFRRAGRAMPPGTTRRELERIDALVARLGARRLTLLGDLFHDEVEPDSPTARTFSRWLLERSDLEVTLVRGNHDRHAVEFIEQLELRAVAEPLRRNGLVYRHHPEGEGPFVAGHVHPGVRLMDGTDRARLPVFWEKEEGLILPAFGQFTGLQIVSGDAGDRMYAVTPSAVLEVPRALCR